MPEIDRDLVNVFSIRDTCSKKTQGCRSDPPHGRRCSASTVLLHASFIADELG